MEGLGKELLGEIESLDKLFKTEVAYHIKRLKRTFKKNQNHTKYKQTSTLFYVSLASQIISETMKMLKSITRKYFFL